MPRVEVRVLKNVEECRQCELVQTHVWGGPVATRELLTATQKYGGAVIGTLVDGKVGGFIYAFLAQYHGRLAHWSHLMAVEAKYRDLGLGFRMKLVHRQIALARGLKSICWTFDPLQSRNARLNISRLGAVAEEYVPDCYGRFPSLLEKGLPSDRWVVNWRIGTARVEKRLRGDIPPFDPALPRVNETRLNAQGFPQNRAIRLNLDDRRLLVETPAQTDAMRTKAMPLARRWRLEARRIFQNYLSAGYRVEDFFPPQAATEGRCFYLLQRTPEEQVKRQIAKGKSEKPHVSVPA
jgi:predicted GNAT superfamily acetyltransferase